MRKRIQKFGIYYLIMVIILMGCTRPKQEPTLIYHEGAIIWTDTTKKQIHLVFTGDEYGEGGNIIRKTLADHHIKASFFFTGNLYRNPAFKSLIEGLVDDGHYLGAHSNHHLLYASWENRDSTLVSRDEFEKDLLDNYAEMARFGIKKEDAPYFLPPYEWYNKEIAQWTRDLGFVLINFTPGTSSNADYTIPSMGNKYLSSEEIFNRILSYEEQNGLNGFILLLHLGVHPERPDPFYYWLDELITLLKARGYEFVLLDKAIPVPN